MSIIKRKAGSEDIVKSVLEFDAVPTEGSPNMLESGAVANAVEQAKAEASEIHDGGSKTEADLVEGVLTIASTNSITKLTLTTAQTLTVLANEGVPNFALEIDNTGNSNDVTVTVKDSTGTTTLKASAAGGNTVGTGKYYQLTCVGSCWTLAEFTVPTP